MRASSSPRRATLHDGVRRELGSDSLVECVVRRVLRGRRCLLIGHLLTSCAAQSSGAASLVASSLAHGREFLVVGPVVKPRAARWPRSLAASRPSVASTPPWRCRMFADLGLFLGVDPAHDVAHRATGECGGVQVRRERLAGLRVPVVAVADGVDAGLRGLAQPGGDPHRARPRSAAVEWRPASEGRGRRSGRVVDPHVALLAAMLDAGVEQVRLDRGGDDRSVPLEERRDREAGGLAATGRSDDREADCGSAASEVRPA